MRRSFKILNTFVAAILLTCGSLAADEAALDQLFQLLRQPDVDDWESIEQEIWQEWSESGSPTIDLLLERGRQAMTDGDLKVAIEHFSAVIDHAPDFAEGWNARATAFFASERYGLSIADIQRTLILNPRHFGALQGLGRILEEMGHIESSLQAYRKAFDLNPHRPGLKEAIERLSRQVGGVEL